ncbi:MAG: SHOCT domain-containing protein [Pseudomonadota bacterium]|nr:SHOCT domain-containing protein [Pseudomonadota bacterium]
MTLLTDDGQRIVADMSARYGVSQDAVLTLIGAVNAGGLTQAQFSHPELGGMGQWSQGGMIMIGDMFNNGLKWTVDQMCNEAANHLRGVRIYAPPPPPAPGGLQGQGPGASLHVPGGGMGGFNAWWPQDLGQPASSGSQNDMSYAVFPQARRLAIRLGGQVTVYDLGDHQVWGFSQQQGGDQSLTFSSQFGVVRVTDLPMVQAGGQTFAPPPPPAPAPEPWTPPEPPMAFAPEPLPEPAPASQFAPQGDPQAGRTAGGMSTDELFALIGKLADLRDKGILSEDEFQAKKTDLLSRI